MEESIKNKLCDYGCGKPAVYQFNNGKWCCSKSYNSCECVRRKRTGRKFRNRKIHYVSIITNKLCDYGCGQRAKFYFVKVKKYCCSYHYLKCPIKHKESINGWRDSIKKIKTKEICSFGCGQKAKYKLKNGKYCCSFNHSSCSEIRNVNSKINRIKQAGENNANWRGGISSLPYSPKWTVGLRRRIKERDNYTCMNSKDCRKNSKFITIHHIDYNKMNCKEENLIVLCNSCNCRANYSREKWESFYKEIIRKKYKIEEQIIN